MSKTVLPGRWSDAGSGDSPGASGPREDRLRSVLEAPRPAGYVYHFDVEGCRAVDRSGRELGLVTGLTEAGGRSLLEVRTPSGERDVPFVEPIVVSVDLASRTVVLDPPAGLLDG